MRSFEISQRQANSQGEVEIEEKWVVELRDSTGGGATGSSILPSKTGGGGGDAGGFMGLSSADMAFQKQKSKKEYQWFEGMFKSINKFLPMLGVAGGIYALVKSSQVSQAALGSISSILGAVVDVFLAPLMPIFMAIMEAVTPLVPIIADAAKTIFTPIVAVITTLMKPLEVLSKWAQDYKGWVEPLFRGILAALTIIGGRAAVSALTSVFGKLGLAGGAGMVGGPLGAAAILAAMFGPEIAEFLVPKINDYIEKQQDITQDVETKAKALEDRNREQKWEDYIKNSPDPDEMRRALRESKIYSYGSNASKMGVHGDEVSPDDRHLGGYIAKTGLYELERGEEVRRASSSSMQTAPIYVENIFQNSFATTVNVDEFMATIEQRITESVKNAIRRAR